MASFRPGDKSPTRTRRVAVACAAAAVFLAGMATRSALHDGTPAEAPPQTSAPATPSTGPGGTQDAGSAPAGFARTEDGARAAAIAYTATLSQRLLYLDPTAVEAAVRAVAADASADSLTADALAALNAAREPLAAGTGATWWVVNPLAVKVEAFSPSRARVSVWLVRVLSQPGVLVPQSSWLTETVELVWEAGDWRLWSDASTPGPTPIVDGSDLPASAAELEAELVGFELVERGDGGW